MTTTPTDQRQLARQLAVELEECGHDVRLADVLDALASTGLELVEGGSGAAAEAYQQLIREGGTK